MATIGLSRSKKHRVVKNLVSFVTPHEIEFGKYNANNFVLFRIFNFNLEVGKGDYFELKGDLR